MIVATMTFIARGSVPLNKAPVFIERKDISLSNYSAGGVSTEKKKKGKGLSFRNPIDPPPFHTMVAYGARGLRVDHKRVHPAERCRYKRADRKRRGLRRRSRGVGPRALNPLLDILIRLSPGCSR